MLVDCLSTINLYLDALKQQFDVIQETENSCRLVTPFLKPDGDAIEIVITESRPGWLKLSDEYLTFDYLFVNGLNLDSNRDLYRQAESIVHLRGATLGGSEIFLETQEDNLGAALNNIVSAIEAVNYLIYKRTHRQKKSFSDEVEIYLTENNFTIETSYQIQGQTILHPVPIYINSSRDVVVSPLSTTSTSIAKKDSKVLAFTIMDVKIIRPNIRFLAILDNRKENRRKPWENMEVQAVLRNHVDLITTWDDRYQAIEFLR
ncbi:DUF1828 domain-containing protein [Candidatus Leptofilum sp.]|uniref:DUF1828 domain-containing protein n=1 Tax=Candidatus Leptofilum sp. TaxID=3241576 RepID=UPI003B5975B9